MRQANIGNSLLNKELEDFAKSVGDFINSTDIIVYEAPSAAMIASYDQEIDALDMEMIVISVKNKGFVLAVDQDGDMWIGQSKSCIIDAAQKEFGRMPIPIWHE